jgi:hypothetical protein
VLKVAPSTILSVSLPIIIDTAMMDKNREVIPLLRCWRCDGTVFEARTSRSGDQLLICRADRSHRFVRPACARCGSREVQSVGVSDLQDASMWEGQFACRECSSDSYVRVKVLRRHGKTIEESEESFISNYLTKEAADARAAELRKTGLGVTAAVVKADSRGPRTTWSITAIITGHD